MSAPFLLVASFVRWHGSLALIVFLTAATLARDEPPALHGKRIWESRIDEQTTLVVDECGPMYVWRLLKGNGNDQRPIMMQLGRGIGSGAVYPITVLDANMVHARMVTVFNQSGECWGCVVQVNPDGTTLVHPGVSPGYYLFGPCAIACKELKEGRIEIAEGKPPTLIGKDEKGQNVRFEIRSRQVNGYKDEYWQAVPLPATRASTQPAAAATR